MLKSIWSAVKNFARKVVEVVTNACEKIREVYDKAQEKVRQWKAAHPRLFTFGVGLLVSLPIVAACNMTFAWPFVFAPLAVEAAIPAAIALLIFVNLVFWFIPAWKAASAALDGDLAAIALNVANLAAVPFLIVSVAATLGGAAFTPALAVCAVLGAVPMAIRAFWAVIA